jgi:hypothetical protein
MPKKGIRFTEEHKRKISLARKGIIFSDKQKHKMSISARKRKHNPHSEETKNKIGLSNKGKLKGRKLSEEIKKKISDKLKKRIIGFGLNPIFTKEHREKLSLSHKGEKSHFWKGGISLEEYTVDWTETLRKSIRERDKYICCICGEKQGDIAHDIHHIDYNKKNCNPNNLITLCHSCHSKTTNNRNEWIIFFQRSCRIK